MSSAIDDTAAAVDPRRMHAQAIKTAAADRWLFNHLITLYSKSNLLSDALRVFHTIPSPNVVSWTSIISAYSSTPFSLRHFVSMLRHSTLPNQRTIASLLKTCASLPSLSFGLQLHSVSVKLSLSIQHFAASALIHFYCKTHLLDDARNVFDEMPERDEVSYSSIIVGLAQNSRPIDALSCFADMRRRDFLSTLYSLSAALRAAADLAALEQCRIFHGHAVVTGLNLNVIVGSALVDGYGKCGLVSAARAVFDEQLADLNVVRWNTMMAAYAQQGDQDSVLELFGSFEAQGLVPDEYSFLAILTAFCNAGLAEETKFWFRKMQEDYRMEPLLEHYTCLVGAMGKAGQLEEAERIAMTMPYKPDAAVWRTLLSSGAYHGNADMASKMSNQLLELKPNDDSAYVIVANVLAEVGRLDEVKEVRKLMRDKNIRKIGGRSWIEVCGEVHVFLAGDRKHPRMKEIYAKLRELMEEIEKLGYVPDWNAVLHEVDERQKREALWYHSEKLALAFGVLSGGAAPGKALRIVKNLRICRDCHEAFKYITSVIEREIIVRDVNRYHRFLDGSCTCGDYW